MLNFSQLSSSWKFKGLVIILHNSSCGCWWLLASPGHQQPWYWSTVSIVFQAQHHMGHMASWSIIQWKRQMLVSDHGWSWVWSLSMVHHGYGHWQWFIMGMVTTEHSLSRVWSLRMVDHGYGHWEWLTMGMVTEHGWPWVWSLPIVYHGYGHWAWFIMGMNGHWAWLTMGMVTDHSANQHNMVNHGLPGWLTYWTMVDCGWTGLNPLVLNSGYSEN